MRYSFRTRGQNNPLCIDVIKDDSQFKDMPLTLLGKLESYKKRKKEKHMSMLFFPAKHI